jgi:predicted phage terminase large subunit-like protein
VKAYAKSLAQSTRAAEKSLIEFTKQAWHIIEPNEEFKDNWHLHLIAEHLEELFDNPEAADLVINVPPGCMKSILTSVMWPAWVWAHDPSKRFMGASYSEELSIRDAMKTRDIITSEWYRERWPHVELKKGEDQKIKYGLMSGGWRLSTSTGGRATGEHPDFKLCLRDSEKVVTDQGLVRIGDLVDTRRECSVLSLSASGQLEWKPVVGWHENPASEMLRVELTNGTSITCTPDHKVRTLRGWVEVQNLLVSDTVATVTAHLQPSGGGGVALPTADGANGGLTGPVLLSELPKGQVGGKDVDYLLRGESDTPVVGDGDVLRVFGPHTLASDVGDAGLTDAESRSQFRSWGVGRRDLAGVSNSEFAAERANGTVATRILNVLLVGAIGKVIESVVRRVAVKVSRYVLSNSRPAKRQQHETVHHKLANPIPPRERDFRVGAVASLDEGEHLGLHLPPNAVAPLSGPCDPTHPAVGGDMVVRVVGDGRPEFVGIRRGVYAGHSLKTYCITVHENNSFVTCDESTHVNMNMSGLVKGIVSHNCDDPHSAAQAQSDAERSRALDWFDGTLSTRGVSRGARTVVIMQRLHQKDITGHILEDLGGYDHICIPMRFEGKSAKTSHPEDPRTKVGELLWPTLFPEDTVMVLEKRLGEYGASGQLQQQPNPPGGGILKTEGFQKWPVDKPLPVFQYVLQSYDTAFTEKTSGDPTACTVWGVFSSENKQNVMLLDCWAEHLSYPKLREKVISDWSATYGGKKDDPLNKPRRSDLVLVEQKGSGQSILQDLRAANIPARGYNPGRADKITRAHSVAPILELGCLFIPESAKQKGEFVSWARPMLSQLEKFPNGEHDDLVDTLTQGLIYLRDSGLLELEYSELIDEPEEVDYSHAKRVNPYAE